MTSAANLVKLSPNLVKNFLFIEFYIYETFELHFQQKPIRHYSQCHGYPSCGRF